MRTCEVKTPVSPQLFGTAEVAAKKDSRAFLQGLKPIDGQILNVGAEAPTP
jgi:hypothetical protein